MWSTTELQVERRDVDTYLRNEKLTPCSRIRAEFVVALVLQAVWVMFCGCDTHLRWLEREVRRLLAVRLSPWWWSAGSVQGRLARL